MSDRRFAFTVTLAVRSAKAFAHVSPSMALLVEHGRVVSTGHKVALRIAVAQLRRKVPRGRTYYITNAQLDRVAELVA